MCQMLLSINPQHVDSIIAGGKKYEYRKVRCRKDVDSILIYETAPVMRVIGEVMIEDILEDSLDTVWKLTEEFSGITKSFYDKYYMGKEKAIAYRLGEIKVFDEPLTLEEIGISCAPQSFRYMPESV